MGEDGKSWETKPLNSGAWLYSPSHAQYGKLTTGKLPNTFGYPRGSRIGTMKDHDACSLRSHVVFLSLSLSLRILDKLES